jgi:LPPG:FO 2-phospho-L-lactate transferase
LYTFLSGGTGTPKLLEGYRSIVDDPDITVICNMGDDILWNGLRVSPDLDTVLYLFSGKLDLSKYWGVKDETFNALSTLEELGYSSWFNIGDRDLGLHIARKVMQENGMTITQITQKICSMLNIEAEILPMSDQLVQSVIHSEEESMGFQEFFVKHRSEVDVKRVTYEGQRDTTTEVLSSIDRSKQIIIGPSNPVTSIGPILSLSRLKDKLGENRNKAVAISPIVGNTAFSGPTIKLMRAQGIETSILGLAQHYQKIISKLVISESDRNLQPEILDLGIEPIVLPIQLQNIKQKTDLAISLLELL